MEVIDHEVAGAVLVAPLIGAVRTDAEKEVVAVLQGDIDFHALHVLCCREAASMTGKGRAVVCVSNVIVARRAVAVVGFRRPVLYVTIVAALVVGEEASRAVEVLLHPHAAAHLVDAGAQLLGRNPLVEAQGLGDGAVRGRLADVGLLSVLVLRCLVHAALQSHPFGQLLPACQR